MIILLVIIFGAVVGISCFTVYGSGYGVWWDVGLGIGGSVIVSAIMTFAYVFNGFNKEDVIGLNWYSMFIGVIGALTAVYGGLLYNKPNTMRKIGFNITLIK